MSRESGLRAEIDYLRTLLRRGAQLAEEVGADCSPEEHEAFQVEWEKWIERASEASLPGVAVPVEHSSGDDQ